MGIKIVPQQEAWVVEFLGKYDRVLNPGLNIIIPFVQSVAYKFSLKEQVVDVTEQVAITQDNVSLKIDGILYIRVIDPKLAAYGVSDPFYAVSQLAQTSMRSEIGKISLDRTFEERELLNSNIVTAINEASQQWGTQCMRYEIKDITPPPSILNAMELQMTAERKKRAEILESEGQKTSQINLAEARKRDIVLQSEASREDQINRAKGEAEAIRAVAEATRDGIINVAEAINKQGGEEAVSLRIAEQYVEAFSKLARTNNTILLPSNLQDTGSMVASALAVFDNIKNTPRTNVPKPPFGG
ncbi:MAG: stomatin-like protein [Pseudomonadota bacterium]